MPSSYQVVIVGAGPAGLFCALELTKQGITDVLVLDSGRPIEERECPKSTRCDCSICDILQGEGGAGGFSDGKKTYSLNRGTQMEEIFDPSCEPILKEIDADIVRFAETEGNLGKSDGALYCDLRNSLAAKGLIFETYPLRHIGTDGVQKFTAGIRDYLRARGVTIASRVMVDDIRRKEYGEVAGVTYRRSDHSNLCQEVYGDQVVIAAGLAGAWHVQHWLNRLHIVQHSGPAGIGIRVETPASILEDLFQAFYDWKIHGVHHEMLIRSFCCNHRGFVVNERHTMLGIRNVNGHSYLDPERRSDSSNFAIILKINSGQSHMPQALVRSIAKDINRLAGERSAAQQSSAFIRGELGQTPHASVMTNRQAKHVNIAMAMPIGVYSAFQWFLEQINEVVPGIVSERSIVYAPEMKYYAQKADVNLRTWKAKDYNNLYIIGHATGYLDSFVSCALTGVIAARDMVSQ